MEQKEILQKINFIESELSKLKEQVNTKESFESVWGELVGWNLTVLSYHQTGESRIHIKNGCNTLFYIDDGVLLYVKKEIYDGLIKRLGIDNKECSARIRAILKFSFLLRISNEPIGVFTESLNP